MFDDRILTLAGLVTFELPGYTIRACDGGQVKWGSEIFRSADPEFGTIDSVGSFSEESGDQAAAGQVTFLPKDGVAAATLSSPAYQLAPVRFWLAQIDTATGEVDGDPMLLADMEIDTTEIEFGKDYRRLTIATIPAAERLFIINEGNTLSEAFHKAVWPGETGLDNATGVASSVPWGTAGAPRGSTSVASGTSSLGRGLAARV